MHMRIGGGMRRSRLAVALVGVLLVGAILNAPPGAATVAAAPATATSAQDGAMFGEFAGLFPTLPLASGDIGPTSYLPGQIKWQGRNNGILSTFGNINEDANIFGLPGKPGYLPVIWNDWRSVPMYSIVETQHTNQQVMAGANDERIVNFGVRLANFINGVGDTGVDEYGVAVPPGGRRVYLRLLIEPNAHYYATYSPFARMMARPAEEHTCAVLAEEEAAYVGAWQYIRDHVMYADPATKTNPRFGPDQVQWIFNTMHVDITQISAELWDSAFGLPRELRNCPHYPGKSYGPSQIMESIYPGDEYADSVSIDGFHYVYAEQSPGWEGPECLETTEYTYPTTNCGFDLPPERLFNSAIPADDGTPVAGMLDRLRARANKPVGIDEVGASTMSMDNGIHKTPAEKSDWIRMFYAWVEANDIRRVVWDNANRIPTDWSIYAPDHVDPVLTMSRGDATDTYNFLTYNVYTGYKEGINRPHFIEPDGAEAGNTRLVSDASFMGTYAADDGTAVVTESPAPALAVLLGCVVIGVMTCRRWRTSA